jgi:hypothetical protein
LAQTANATKGLSVVLEGSNGVQQVDVSIYESGEAHFVETIKAHKRFDRLVPPGQQASWIDALISLRREGYPRWMHCLLAMKRSGFATHGDLRQVVTHLQVRAFLSRKKFSC